MSDSCDTKENSNCATTCDSGYHTLADGESATINWRCSCTGDRSDPASMDCNYEIVDSTPKAGATCVQESFFYHTIFENVEKSQLKSYFDSLKLPKTC